MPLLIKEFNKAGNNQKPGVCVINGFVGNDGEAYVFQFDQNDPAVPVKTAGKLTTGRYFFPYGFPNIVTTSAYTEVVASIGGSSEIEIFDSSGQAFILAVGLSGNEIPKLIITPGGNGLIPYKFGAGERVSIKSLTETAEEGFLIINCYE